MAVEEILEDDLPEDKKSYNINMIRDYIDFQKNLENLKLKRKAYYEFLQRNPNNTMALLEYKNAKNEIDKMKGKPLL